MDSQLQRLKKDFITASLPSMTKFEKQASIGFMNESCHLDYVITSVLWYKIRIFKTFIKKLLPDEPLYWLLKNNQTQYIEKSFPKQKINYRINQEGSIHLFIFSEYRSAQRFNWRACLQYIGQFRDYLPYLPSCYCNNISSNFTETYHEEENTDLLEQINTEYPFIKYTRDIAKYFNHPKSSEYEGFISKRETLLFKGLEYELVELKICHQEYKEYLPPQDSLDREYLQEEQQRIPTIHSSVINSKICIFSHIIRDQHRKIQSHKAIQLENDQALNQLQEERYDKIFLDIKDFLKSFTKRETHQFQDEYHHEENPQLPFQRGSILIIIKEEVNYIYRHAAVYLGSDDIIYINTLNMDITHGKFRDYLADYSEVEEIIFDLNFFTNDQNEEDDENDEGDSFNYYHDEEQEPNIDDINDSYRSLMARIITFISIN